MSDLPPVPPLSDYLGIEDVGDLTALHRLTRYLHRHPTALDTLGVGKTMVLLFFNPSLRTRLSTQRAAQLLGMHVIVLNVGESWQLEFEDGAVMQLDRAEHVREAAGVISQYADVIGIRTFAGLSDRAADYRDQVIRAFQRHATVPVLSLESATRHPLQGLADWLTIDTHRRTARPRVVLSWAPHPKALPQAVPNSFVRWMQTAAVDLIIAHPPGLELSPEIIGDTPVTSDQRAALEGADFVYAKNWSSYTDYGRIGTEYAHWIIDRQKMQLGNNAQFMHCLPVRRNVVVSDAVLDSSASLVLRQAANRTVAAQAVIAGLLAGLPNQ